MIRLQRRAPLATGAGSPARARAAEPQLDSWLAINREIDNYVPGVLAFDPNPCVEDPQRPAEWRDRMSGDHIHLNMKGDTALMTPFETMLRQIT